MNNPTQDTAKAQAIRSILLLQHEELLKVEEFRNHPERCPRLLELEDAITHWEAVIDKLQGGTFYQEYERDLGFELMPNGDFK